VNKKFDDLQKLQDNKWQPVAVPGKEVVKVCMAPKALRYNSVLRSLKYFVSYGSNEYSS